MKFRVERNLYGMVSIGAGAFLLIEHIYSYGGLDFYDILGHEWFGLLLVLLGFIGNLRFRTNKKQAEIDLNLKYQYGA